MNRDSRFCGKKQIKTEGKKEHCVVQRTWDGGTILNSNNKNGCRPQHRTVHTDYNKNMASTVQETVQGSVFSCDNYQLLTVICCSRMSCSNSGDFFSPYPPTSSYWYFPPTSAEIFYQFITSKHFCAHIFNSRTLPWKYVATHCFPSTLRELYIADGMGISQLCWRWHEMIKTTKAFGCSETVSQCVNFYKHSSLLSEY